MTSQTRSYFFNEVDGLESNDGILMVASTNYLDRLDPGLSKRPSRFDRKYLFPQPDQHERTLYAQYWRNKVLKKGNDIDFPDKICPAIADVTDGFSFAYMQEAFVATLLSIARGEDDHESYEEQRAASAGYRLDYADESYPRHGDGHHDLDSYPFWRKFKETVRSLREDMGDDEPSADADLGSDLLQALKSIKLDRTAPTPEPEIPTAKAPGRVARPYGSAGGAGFTDPSDPLGGAESRSGASRRESGFVDPERPFGDEEGRRSARRSQPDRQSRVLDDRSRGAFGAPFWARGDDQGSRWFEQVAERAGTAMFDDMEQTFGHWLGGH